MMEALRATVRTNLLSLFLEPLLEANLAKMLTTAICEVRLVQKLSADNTKVILWRIPDKAVLLHFRVEGGDGRGFTT